MLLFIDIEWTLTCFNGLYLIIHYSILHFINLKCIFVELDLLVEIGNASLFLNFPFRIVCLLAWMFLLSKMLRACNQRENNCSQNPRKEHIFRSLGFKLPLGDI